MQFRAVFNQTHYGRVGASFLQVDDDGLADDRVVNNVVDVFWFGDGFWVDGEIAVDLHICMGVIDGIGLLDMLDEFVKVLQSKFWE